MRLIKRLNNSCLYMIRYIKYVSLAQHGEYLNRSTLCFTDNMHPLVIPWLTILMITECWVSIKLDCFCVVTLVKLQLVTSSRGMISGSEQNVWHQKKCSVPYCSDRTCKNVPILSLGTFQVTEKVQAHHDHVIFAFEVFVNFSVLNDKLPSKFFLQKIS